MSVFAWCHSSVGAIAQCWQDAICLPGCWYFRINWKETPLLWYIFATENCFKTPADREDDLGWVAHEISTPYCCLWFCLKSTYTHLREGAKEHVSSASATGMMSKEHDRDIQENSLAWTRVSAQLLFLFLSTKLPLFLITCFSSLSPTHDLPA